MSIGMRAGSCEAEPDRCSQSQKTRKSNALSNAIERADGEWCTLEMNKVALLPRETRKLCLGRGPAELVLLLVREIRAQETNLRVLLAAVGAGRATCQGHAGDDEWLVR